MTATSSRLMHEWMRTERAGPTRNGIGPAGYVDLPTPVNNGCTCCNSEHRPGLPSLKQRRGKNHDQRSERHDDRNSIRHGRQQLPPIPRTGEHTTP